MEDNIKKISGIKLLILSLALDYCFNNNSAIEQEIISYDEKVITMEDNNDIKLNNFWA